jgi:hypothetical protein
VERLQEHADGDADHGSEHQHSADALATISSPYGSVGPLHLRAGTHELPAVCLECTAVHGHMRVPAAAHSFDER